MSDISFTEAAAANGFYITNPFYDGKIHRFGRKGSRDSGWYVAHSVHINGRNYIYASYGDWKTGENYSYTPNVMKSKNWRDQAKINAEIARSQREAQAERQNEQQKAAEWSQNHWENLIFGEAPTEYMKKKKIPDLYGCKVLGDLLVVPARDEKGKLWSLQYIHPDGQKRFVSKGRVKGCFHTILGNGSGNVYICEGFSTGASLHQATGTTVVVTFSASNLVEVVKKLIPTHNLTHRLFVCGDDDVFTEANAGRTAALSVKDLVDNRVYFPKFSSHDGNPTDFNDLHCREGLDEVRKQLGL